MTININYADYPGQVGVSPRIVKIVTDSNLATVTSAGWINSAVAEGFSIQPTDMILISYNGGTNFFTPAIVSGVITLSALESLGNVLLPVVAGHLASFNGTTGQIKDSGAALSSAQPFAVASPGSLTPGQVPLISDANGTISGSGAMLAHEGDAFIVTQAATVIIGQVPEFSNANGQLSNSSLMANKVLSSSITNPDVNANLLSLTITMTAAALATAGKVQIIPAASGKQYQIINMWLNGGGTGFNGVGDRSVGVTDGTTTWGTLTNTTLGSIPITQWGASGFAYSVTNRATLSVAGAEIYLQYNGGTTDYGTGSVTLTFLIQRVA